MVLVTWSLNEATLKGCHECTLSLVSTSPYLIVDVARMQKNKAKQSLKNVQSKAPRMYKAKPQECTKQSTKNVQSKALRMYLPTSAVVLA